MKLINFPKNKIVPISAALLLVCGIVLTLFVSQQLHETRQHVTGGNQLAHFTGGFGIVSDAEIANAAADGIESILDYGYNPTGTDSRSTTLKANNMKIIDQMPEKYLRSYGAGDITPTTLLTDITNHLQQEQHNAMIIAYWVLDDWNYGDGSAKDMLVQINKLIHQYTPGKPSICGFGGGIPPLPSKGGWDDKVTDNFSPQGCDMIGLYIYADNNSTGSYDWSMSNILPAAFASFKQRGWEITNEPLVGIPQAFGGDVSGTNWPVPDANAVETQTKTYCQQGATGIIYYNWDPTAQSPMTNSQITQGIKNGLADCKNIWGNPNQ